MPSPLITVLDANNQPMKALPLEEVQRRLAAGEFRPDQLAHTAGLTDWTALAEVISYVGGQALHRAVPMIVQPPEVVMEYASFWRRLAAFVIDRIILLAGLYIPLFAFWSVADTSFVSHYSAGKDSYDYLPDWAKLATNTYMVVFFLAAVFWYFPAREGGRHQATIGKMALGLKVTSMSEEPIGYWHALGRTFARVPSSFLCYAGYLMAAFTEKEQALHDMLAATLVMQKSPPLKGV